jgi:hypothetical protein
LLLTNLLPNFYQLPAELLEEVIIFDLDLQTADLLQVMKPTPNGSTAPLAGEKRIRARPYRLLLPFSLEFQKLTGDGPPAHFFQGVDKGKNFLTHTAKSGEGGHGRSPLL